MGKKKNEGKGLWRERVLWLEGGKMHWSNGHYYFRSKSGTVQLCTRSQQHCSGHYRDHTSTGAYFMSTDNNNRNVMTTVLLKLRYSI